MSRIFISHSSIDNFIARALANWLAEEGWADVFLDIDPERGIAAGQRWERALHQAADRCEAVVFVVTRAWIASGWCRKEYELSRRLNKQLFAVVAERGLGIVDLLPELKDTWQVTDLVAGSDHRLFRAALPSSEEERHVSFSRAGLARLRTGLKNAGLDAREFLWPPEGAKDPAPYVGLRALGADEAGLFFGRDADLVKALDRLRGLSEAAAPRIAVILGASGAGKSSFLRAGLLPRMARDDARFLCLPAIRPARDPVEGETGLIAALDDAVTEPHARADIRTAVSKGADGVRALLGPLVRAAMEKRLVDQETSRAPVVVVPVDQAEELFSAETDGEALLALLAALAADDVPAVMLLFAMRSDAYDALERAKALEGLAQTALPLLPMPRHAARAIIEGPAARYAASGRNLDLDPRLTQALLDDLDQGGGRDTLPLLAFSLEHLWREYGRTGTLTAQHYDTLGGVAGAIEAGVRRAYVRGDLHPGIPRDAAARDALLRRGLVPWLAGIDPDTRAPRRMVARADDIPAESKPLIDLLVEERLLSRSVDEAGVATIEPVHEALLRQWGKLKGWLAEDFALLAALEAVQRASRDWDANGRVEPWLAHRGQRLAEAASLDARPDLAAKLGIQDRTYLAACRAHEEAIRAEAERMRVEREEARERELRDARSLAAQTRTALSNQAAALAALSSNALRENPARAIKLALAAWPRSSADPAPKLTVAVAVLSEAMLVLRERRVFRGHGGEVTSAAFSPDGQRVVTASLDKTARVWNAATGQTIVMLQGHDAPLRSATFSPDGVRVVTASDDTTARIWNAATGQATAVLEGHSRFVTGAVFSLDGARVLTTSYDSTARVWSAETGQPLAVLEGHNNSAISENPNIRALFSPDGTRIVTAAADKIAQVWSAATGQPIASLQGHASRVNSAAFSPDGTRLVTASHDRTARVWDAATGRPTVVLEGHTGFVTGAVFSPDGTRVVTRSYDGTARVWEATTGKLITVLQGLGNPVTSAVFSPDGMRVVMSAYDDTPQVWNAATGQKIDRLKGHEGRVTGAVFSPDGSCLVTASDDTTARLWDVATEQPIIVLDGHDGCVNSARFSPDGARVVTASEDATARVWDVRTGRTIVVFRDHNEYVAEAVFSPDGERVVTISEDSTASVWDAAKGQPIATLGGHGSPGIDVAFSPDGARLVMACDERTTRVWDAATGRAVAVLKGHTDVARGAAFSPDGARVVTASNDKTARVWDAATGQPILVLEGHDSRVRQASFSPDGTRVVTASNDKTARVWDAATGQPIAVLKGHTAQVCMAVFSPDGSRVITASDDKTARMWSGTTGQPIAMLEGHADRVGKATFSPDGMRLVTASADRTARIWDAATGLPIAVLKGHDAQVCTAVFSPNGSRVVTASDDNTARIWDISSIPKGDIFHVACAWLPDHDLTDIARDYGLTDLAPICQGDPPLPDPPDETAY